MSETVDLPNLDDIPTTPPPPPSPEPHGPSVDFERRQARRARSQRPASPFWKVAVLILATQAALVVSAVLAALGRPSAVAAVLAVVLTDIFITVVLARSR